MAEAFLNDLGQGKFISESAGLEKGTLNPVVVEAMAEIGYDGDLVVGGGTIEKVIKKGEA